MYKFSIVAEPIEGLVVKIGKSSDIEKYIRGHFEDICVQESFYVIMLDRQNVVMGHKMIGKGNRTATVVDVALVAKYAIESLCSSVVLVHNHPSGAMRPSVPDMNLTSNIKKGLALFDIGLLDHLILAPQEGVYYSFADSRDL